MVITAVEKNKGNKKRYSVYVDDSYSFSVSEEDYYTLNLYEKKEITEEEIKYIKDSVNFREAKNLAIRFLSLKMRCEKEVASKLEKEGFDEKTAARVIDELKSMGYLNDELYVQKYLYDRSKLKPKSKKMLSFELKNKGVTEEIIEKVLEDWNLDDSEIAEGLVKRKFGKYDLTDEKIIRKATLFLMHRGFSYEIIKKVLRNLADD